MCQVCTYICELAEFSFTCTQVHMDMHIHTNVVNSTQYIMLILVKAAMEGIKKECTVMHLKWHQICPTRAGAEVTEFDNYSKCMWDKKAGLSRTAYADKTRKISLHDMFSAWPDSHMLNLSFITGCAIQTHFSLLAAPSGIGKPCWHLHMYTHQYLHITDLAERLRISGNDMIKLSMLRMCSPVCK